MPRRFWIFSIAWASGSCRSVPRPAWAGENGCTTTFIRSRSVAQAAARPAARSPRAGSARGDRSCPWPRRRACPCWARRPRARRPPASPRAILLDPFRLIEHHGRRGTTSASRRSSSSPIDAAVAAPPPGDEAEAGRRPATNRIDSASDQGVQRKRERPGRTHDDGPPAGRRPGQAEARLDDHRHHHRDQEQPPDFLDQRADVPGLVVDAGEVEAPEQLGHAVVGQDRRQVLGGGAVDRQQAFAGRVDAGGGADTRSTAPSVGPGQSLPRRRIVSRRGRRRSSCRVLPSTAAPAARARCTRT